MADYISKHSGKQIDDGIDRANALKMVRVSTEPVSSAPTIKSISLDNVNYNFESVDNEIEFSTEKSQTANIVQSVRAGLTNFNLPQTDPIYRKRLWYSFILYNYAESGYDYRIDITFDTLSNSDTYVFTEVAEELYNNNFLEYTIDIPHFGFVSCSKRKEAGNVNVECNRYEFVVGKDEADEYYFVVRIVDASLEIEQQNVICKIDNINSSTYNIKMFERI